MTDLAAALVAVAMALLGLCYVGGPVVAALHQSIPNMENRR